MWQDLIAVAAALLAAAYLCRRMFRRRGACGPGCHHCPAGDSSADGQLVQLQPPSEESRRPVAAPPRK